MNIKIIIGLSVFSLLCGCSSDSDSSDDATNQQETTASTPLPITPPIVANDDDRFIDTDLDGIADKLDMCSETISNAEVDAQGCLTSIRIQAEDYIEYLDLTDGNAGAQYRNDNVDIFTAGDTDAGYAIRDTQIAEWLSYKVTLPEGYYQLNSRVASSTGAGQYSIYLNDQPIGLDTINHVIGDDKSWSTRRVTKTLISAGEHTLKVFIDEAGVDLNWLEFVATGPTVSCEDGKPTLESNFECEVTPLTAEQSKATQDRIFYEMNFSVLGRDNALQKVTAQLDHITSLNVDTLWLMPLHPRGGTTETTFNVNYLLPDREYSLSPYGISDYLTIEENLGDINDLRLLINEAHKRGVSVILDWVANHTSWNHPWLLNKDWYTQIDNVVVQPQEFAWYDVADLNFDNSQMRAAMIDSMIYWINIGVDGFRCDYAEGVPDDFWQAAISQIRDVNPNAIMLAEGTVNHLNLGFDLTYSWESNTSVKDAIETADATLVTARQELQNSTYNMQAGTHLLRYSTNHDLSAWEENPIQIACVQIEEDCTAFTELAQQGALAQFALHLFYGDVPLIYSGQEVGEEKNISFYGDDIIDWTKNAGVLAEYQQLLSYYSDSTITKLGIEKSYPDDTVVAVQKTHGDKRLVMLTNVLKTENTFIIPEGLQGDYVNALTGQTVVLDTNFVLSAFEYVLLTQDYAEAGPAYGDTQLYIRSDFNGWSADDPMIYVGNKTYIGAANISATGSFYFKFANAEWNFRIGAEGIAPLDQPLVLSILTDDYDPAQTLQIDDIGLYVFTLNTQDPNAPVLTISKDITTYAGVPLYIRGFDDIWDTSRPMIYFGAGYYAFDIIANQNADLSFSKYFKIASEAWSNPNAGGAQIVLNGDFVVVQEVDDAMSLGLTEQTKLRIIYHAIDDTTNEGEVTVLSLPLPPSD